MTKTEEKVIQAVCLVPFGKVASYGQIALMLGYPRAARMVGHILHNLEPDVVYGKLPLPWWRIVNNAGRISIKGNEVNTPQVQKEKLEAEGILVTKLLEFDIENYRFIPSINQLKGLELDDDTIELFVNKFGL